MKWPLILREVRGESMAPTLKPGQLVLAVRRSASPKPGAIVILRHDGIDKIKRLQRIDGGRVFVVGDNEAESLDSRTFGWLPKSAVIAEVVWFRRSG